MTYVSAVAERVTHRRTRTVTRNAKRPPPSGGFVHLRISLRPGHPRPRFAVPESCGGDFDSGSVEWPDRIERVGTGKIGAPDPFT